MPSVTEYLRPELIAQVERLDLRARFIVEGFYAGLHASPYHGFSVEFSEHRKYERGDDLRLIDWNVFAKTDRFYIRQYQAETNLSGYLLLDLSASMAFPTADQVEPGAKPRMSKLNYAVCLAAALGHMMIHQRDSVGLAMLSDKLKWFLPAKSTRAHLMDMLGKLISEKAAGTTNLAASIHDLAMRLKRRSLIILFSDLMCDAEPVLEALGRLRAAGHDLIVFCVLDEAEVNFPFRGPMKFEEPESGELLTSDAATVRDDYLAALEAFIDEYRTGVSRLRGDFVMVHNAMSFDTALVHFLRSRQMRF